MTYETLLVGCLGIGMTVADTKFFTTGMLLDLIFTKGNMTSKNKVRKATQADMDAL